MTLDPNLINILVCPDNRQPLAMAPDNLIETLNQKISQGLLFNVGGHKISEHLERALIRRDQLLAYPIRDSIPILLVEEGIRLAER